MTATATTRPTRARRVAPTARVPVRRLVRDGPVLAGLLFLVYVLFVVGPEKNSFGYDAYAYWTVDLADPYSRPLGSLGFFAYSPVIALAVQPLTWLPWWVFVGAWWALLLAAVVYIGRNWTLALLAFPPVAIELYHGNIHLLLAAAVVLGFRFPAAWALVLLTKVTPGVGLLWFAARREWRSLAIATGASAILAAGSAVLVPSLWTDWLSLLVGNAGAATAWPALPVPLWLRLPVAALLVVWGARRDARWTVPLAATIALPVLWLAGLSMLIACWPFTRWSGRYDARHAAATASAATAAVDRPAGVQRGAADRVGA